ncbi:MAG: exosome complex protein Rrp42 [Promethearchaeota archaeon]
MMGISEVVSSIEKKYILKLLRKGKRIDGRELFEVRDISIQTNIVPKAEGSADVRLGKSRVICGIKYDVGTPFPDSPDEGVATCMTEFIPFASPMFEGGPPTIDSIEVARVVDRGIRHGNCIDYKKLCMKEGKFCYIIFIDIYVMNYYGNLIDTSALAAIAALVSAKIPTAKLSEDESEAIWGGGFMPIPINELPIQITFGKVDDIVFIDPSLPEELIQDGRISFAITESNKISSIQKSGVALWEQDEIIKLSRIAIQKANDIRKKLNLRQYAPKI